MILLINVWFQEIMFVETASVSGFYNIYTAAITTYTTRYNTTYYTRLKHHKLIHGTAMLWVSATISTGISLGST